jgi:hypothetical protein
MSGSPSDVVEIEKTKPDHCTMVVAQTVTINGMYVSVKTEPPRSTDTVNGAPLATVDGADKLIDGGEPE